jgi:hypothetical protein
MQRDAKSKSATQKQVRLYNEKSVGTLAADEFLGRHEDSLMRRSIDYPEDV